MLNKLKTRESSPLSGSNYRRLSREPSPADALNKYNSASTTALLNKTLSTLQTKNPDLSISYMSASESNNRPTRASFINRYSPQKDKTASPSPSMIPLRSESSKVETLASSQQKVESESEESSSTEEESDESVDEDEQVKQPEAKIMIQVTTITRATSPTPPTGSTSSRVRRNELAKTIEKVRQRPLQGPPVLEKATQSDRMDDPTRYSRFGSSSTSRTIYSPYSSSSPSSYSSRLTGVTTSRYTREPSENPSATESDKSEASSSQKSDKFNFKLPKSDDDKSPSLMAVAVNKERMSREANNSKSKTPEKLLPPQSPTKSNRSSDSQKSTMSKVSNKDFRKSVLNMGPTDRVSRSKSSSSENSSPTVEKTRMQFQQMVNGESKTQISLEKSPSVDSESSTESIDVESQIEQKRAEPTKEEIISHKIEEAKSFLLKTLGNANAISAMKSPSPTTMNGSSVSCSTDYPTSTTSNASALSLDFSNLKKNVSGELPWWMEDNNTSNAATRENSESRISDNNSRNGYRDDETTTTTSLLDDFSEMTLKTAQELNDSQSSKWPWLNGSTVNDGFQKLQRVESGEKAWWCKSPENKTSDNQAFAQHNENTRNTAWDQETQADVSELQQDDEEINFRSTQNNSLDINLTQLGDRVGPEGLESKIDHQASPYKDEIIYHKDKVQDFNARPRMFISRHTNIDDLLGKQRSSQALAQ